MNKQQEDGLYHSDIYLGQEYSDGIKHWKYYRREKLSNGKYRYYYKDNDDYVYTTDGKANKYSTYTHKDVYGNTKVKKTVKGDKLFGNTITSKTMGRSTQIVETRTVGILEQNFDSFVKKNQKKINKAKKWLQKIFG